MKNFFFTFLVLTVLGFSTLLKAQETENSDPGKNWPREINVSNAVITIFQPQLESFNGNKIKVRAAISVLKKGEKEPEYCAVWIDAKVKTDKSKRTASFEDIKIDKFAYPDASEKMKNSIEDIIVKSLVQANIHISMDRLLTMMYAVEDEKKKDSLIAGGEVPKFFFSAGPAVLVLIDGKPVIKKMDGNFSIVTNTEYFIAQDDSSKKYYLHCADQWFSSDNLESDWKPDSDIPEAIKKADNKTASKDKHAGDAVPKIFVSTQPAELIQSYGTPVLDTIPGTSLSYLKNSDNDLFRDENDSKLYLLVSGRWFTAESKEGPWTLIKSEDLPEDFKKIPDSSPKANVLASITGTEEAEDATLESYIPQTATLKREKADLKIEYDGEPVFEPVKSTSLEYAVNTSSSVIKSGAKYYACVDGAWFVADSPNGPWAVCVNVPDEIYKIPPDNPNYNTTFVHVYDYDDDYVNVGYTAGYLGSFVLGGCLVFGTGYAYHCWARDRWCPRPITYGCRFRYNHYSNKWHCYDRYRLGNGRYVAWNNRPNPLRNQIPPRARGTYRGGNSFANARRTYSGSKLALTGLGVGAATVAARKRLGRVNHSKPNNVYVDKKGNIYRHTLNGWQKREKGKWAKRGSGGPGLRRDALNKVRSGDSAARRKLQDGVKRKDLSGLKRKAVSKARETDNATRRKLQDAVKRNNLNLGKNKLNTKKRLNDSAARRKLQDRAARAKRNKSYSGSSLNRAYHARQRGNYRVRRSSVSRRSSYHRPTRSRRSGGVRRSSGRRGGGRRGGGRRGGGGRRR